MEAVLYSISNSQVEMLKQNGHSSAHLLTIMRNDIHQPITAILTLNTIAGTFGATISGAAAVTLLGDNILAIFTAFFTLSILIFSEIIPKTIGVTYAVKLAPLIARPLYVMVIILKPFIWLSQIITSLIPQNRESGQVSADELRTIASLSQQSGHIEKDQERVIINMLELHQKSVRKVMTPRTVTCSLDQDMTIADTLKLKSVISRHSRIPLYKETPNDVVGIVLLKDILQAAADQKMETQLSQLMIPVHFVAETAPLNRVLMDFFERRQHLFVAVDEYGSVTGIISLEDILEEIIGQEIMDESDSTKNMRELARKKFRISSAPS